MLESDIVRSQVKELNKAPNTWSFRTHGGSFSVRGVPDIIGVSHGRFFSIEAKRTAKLKPSAAQEYIMGKIRDAGGVAFVSHDPKAEEVLQWVKSMNRS